jgi:hypothetical protein
MCIEQLAAQKLGLKKRGTGGSSQRKTRKCVLGGNHSKMRVQVYLDPTVGGGALAVCWLQADVEHVAILCLEFCPCFQLENPV